MSPRSALERYALSLLTVGAAVLISWPLHPLQDISLPLLVLAVLVSAWYGGAGPAFLAAVLSVLAADYFFIEPFYSIDINLAFVERSLTFALILAVVSWFANVRRRAEAELREQTELLKEQTRVLEAARLELKRADRLKDDFLAVLSHELRNPLGAIRNGLYLLRDGRTEDPRHIHDMMERQLKQVLRLVEDLLDVSRITTGKVVLKQEQVELDTVVQDAVDLSRSAIDSMGHHLALHLPEDPVTIRGDRQRLAQVFSNLLNNAAKFTPRGGQIALDAAAEQGNVVVRVRDNGIGIPPDMVDRIFEMFTQADRSASRQNAGLGIGLSLVRGLVEAH
ncbi:MAG TPA: HAMP domain-containing sensor histidine kinase, partial [Candidatus Polarisedimenticolia bacterium]|nr:HAMP domain-containing sensor histidine kinase [Candidatus Polarisedimenticolia bacterium]